MRLALSKLSIAIGLVTASSLVFAVYGGQCVRYVKNQKAGGYVWDKYYPILKNGKAAAATCDAKAIKAGDCVYWIGAKDIWLKLATQSKGAVPKIGAALVMDAIPASAVGHVAIVTAISKDEKTITVTHSNWEASEQISGGTFILDGKGGAKYTTSAGAKWSKTYPILGFVYTP